jgi:uncharacterized protein (TIGR04255 family)
MTRTSPRHYPNAPITEAVLDLRVAPRSNVKVEELSKVIAGDEVAYPTVEAMNAITGSMMVGPAASSTNTVTTHIGFVFRHKDGRYIHQARLDGFTFSELPKYSNWKELRDEAFKRWSQYRDIAKPAGVIRAALRYVNRIDVPEPLTDIQSYLRTFPHISDELPQMTDGYFMQIGIPFNKIEGRATITEAIIQPQKPGFVSIVLDIDVYREYQSPAPEDQVWSMLDQIRDIKNEIFEACLTNKTRELFA